MWFKILTFKKKMYIELTLYNPKTYVVNKNNLLLIINFSEKYYITVILTDQSSLFVIDKNKIYYICNLSLNEKNRYKFRIGIEDYHLVIEDKVSLRKYILNDPINLDGISNNIKIKFPNKILKLIDIRSDFKFTINND